MTGFVHGMTHGFRGFEVLYVVTLLGYLVGLILGRRPSFKLLLASPLAAALFLLIDMTIGEAAVVPIAHHMGMSASLIHDVLVTTATCALLSYLWGRIMGSEARDPIRHRRGAFVWPLRRGRRKPRPGDITIAGIPIPRGDEAKHFKIIGATGTGKSTAIREILDAALKRGDRAIIADPDAGYLDIFYDASRGDVILNPFEPDACKWDLFGEVTQPYDLEQLARSLIPDMGGEDRVWSEYARTFFSAVARQLMRVDVRDDGKLLKLIRDASVEELRKLLAGTAAGPFLHESADKMFGSLRSVAISAVKALEFTSEQTAQLFSVRQWVRQGAARQAGGKGGVLFLPYRASQIAALRTIISAWMRLGIFEAMDRPPADQRLWFIVDELDALGAIDGLKDALSRLRKFGGRCVLGFQSIAQVSGTYGREVADTLVENCGNTLILRCSASERGGTSEFASKLIGQREVMHTTQSKTRAPAAWLSSTTTSQQLRIEPAVMASEIERLPDLEGILKIASVPDWERVRLTPVHYPIVIRKRQPEAAVSTPASPAVAAGTADGAVAPAAVSVADTGGPLSVPPTPVGPPAGSAQSAG